jgi:two-component system phosphate regulon response regulator PhoB
VQLLDLIFWGNFKIANTPQVSPRQKFVDEKENIVEIAGIVLDSSTGKAFLEGQPLRLTKTEFRVLFLLMQSGGRVFTREEIIVAVQGDDYPVTARSVDNHVLTLRKKLGGHGNLIETVRGVGFRCRAF